jgi:MFS family permease
VRSRRRAGARYPDAAVTARWVTRTVVGIVLATLLSDVGHEMVTAVLPFYVGGLGLGAAALGVMEGAADLAFSLSKLAGGAIGHRARRKRPWATAGYLLTTLGTGAIALVRGFAAVAALRTVAWFGRGFRSPLRDFLLADEVGPTHFGRAYGIERSADMIGAVIGPLVAAALVWSGASFRDVILWSVLPSLGSAAAIAVLTRDRAAPVAPAGQAAPAAPAAGGTALPRAYWLFVAGVLLFGLGDFSRTFLIYLAARALGGAGGAGGAGGVLTTAVLLYAAHNLVSALAAYPAGRLGDARSKSRVLVFGYALGVVTNVLLAVASGSLPILVVAITLSGIYIAIEETLEKAVVAELLPRDRRSLGLGVLASANALGDLGSSVFVGAMLATDHATLAFAAPAALGALGVAWMGRLSRRGVVR